MKLTKLTVSTCAENEWISATDHHKRRLPVSEDRQPQEDTLFLALLTQDLLPLPRNEGMPQNTLSYLNRRHTVIPQ